MTATPPKGDALEGGQDWAGVVRTVRETVRKHSLRFERAIPLIASENLLSPYAKELLISDFHSRYAEGLPGDRYYEGNEQVDEVENICTDLARRLFHCSFADVRPISGTVANLAILKALAEPGDLVGTSRLADGAHISSAGFGAFGLRGVKPVYYAWDPERMTIDVPRTREILKAVRPKLCLFGLSLFLFPMPIAELQPHARGDRGPWMVRRSARARAHRGRGVPGPLARGLPGPYRLDPQDPPGPPAWSDPRGDHGRGRSEAAAVRDVPGRDEQPSPARDGGARGQLRRAP